MILGDLLTRPVESDGDRIGVVIDARFALRDSAGRSTAELIGLIVGPRDGAAFLGYERHDVARPHLLNRWFAHRQRGSFLVDIDDVKRIGDVVELRPGFRHWSATLPE